MLVNRLFLHEQDRKHLFFAKCICFCILTGTAAISVGLSTVQSPLLPFLILLDCNKEKKSQCMKLKTKQLYRKGLKNRGRYISM